MGDHVLRLLVGRPFPAIASDEIEEKNLLTQVLRFSICGRQLVRNLGDRVHK